MDGWQPHCPSGKAVDDTWTAGNLDECKKACFFNLIKHFTGEGDRDSLLSQDYTFYPRRLRGPRSARARTVSAPPAQPVPACGLVLMLSRVG